MRIAPATIAYRAYGKELAMEKFQCNYGLNETFRDDLNDGKLEIAGFDEEGNTRIVEIPTHRFFVATLFLPQLSSEVGSPHPLISSFIEAALEFKNTEWQTL